MSKQPDTDILRLTSLGNLFKRCTIDIYSIQDLFQINDNCYCTRQYGKFNHKYVRTSLKYKCVSVYGVKLWNGLNDELSSISSVFKFKVMLKKILLNMS